MSDLHELIPKPEDLPSPKKPDPDYEKWLEWTLKDIAEKLRESGDDIHNGSPLVYTCPRLRDGGKYAAMWSEYWRDVEQILSERGYVVINTNVSIGIGRRATALTIRSSAKWNKRSNP